VSADALAKAVDEVAPIGAALFDALAERTRDTIGITRASYGKGEQAAFDLLSTAARGLGFEVARDHAANLIIKRRGTESDGVGVLSGSHLDSVPSGGNFDGAAGVVAALLALAAFERAGLKTKHDVSAIGFRGEESAWFSIHHIGSRAALGLLPPEEMETARRFDSQRTLADHMAEASCDLDLLKRRHASLPAERVKAFVELHIEQGPVLVHRSVPVGIVTGIRGNARIRQARCIGEYAHSGAVPRDMRRDAVMAMAEFVHAADAEWERLESQGRDLVLTFGKLHTDTALHGHNKVPGTVDFVVDARSHERETLDGVERFLESKAAEIASRRGVRFQMSPVSRIAPAAMDNSIRTLMQQGADELKLQVMDIASGGGHDAGDFANAGVPSGMVFVRNPNGSHNPDEAMTLEDFTQGLKLLTLTLARLAS
jgi:beta-ureidopropionase / N-carbamoyl-L-amino-acid hydrolase